MSSTAVAESFCLMLFKQDLLDKHFHYNTIHTKKITKGHIYHSQRQTHLFLL